MTEDKDVTCPVCFNAADCVDNRCSECGNKLKLIYVDGELFDVERGHAD